MFSLRRSASIPNVVPERLRNGSIIVLSAFMLIVLFAFVAFAVDLSYISLTRTRMQNACDSASMAAAMEITHAVQNAGPNVTNVTEFAMDEARAKAAEVADLNGVYVDPLTDVTFGRRTVDPDTGVANIEWGVSPANCVRVVARRDNVVTTEPDARLPLFFAPILGTESTVLSTQAASYVESRDIALVLDYSSSMNDDSSFDRVASLNSTQRAALNANQEDIFNILKSVRNLGTMPFTPQWLQVSNTVSGDTATGTFRNTQIDVAASSAMTQVVLTFDDNSTQTITSTATSGTFQRSGSAKRITQANVYIANPSLPGNPHPDQTGTGTSSNGRTASATFNVVDNTLSVTRTSNSSSHNIQAVRVYYYGGGGSYVGTTVSPAQQTVSIPGNGTYIYQIRVRLGTNSSSNWAYVYNPYGTSPPAPPAPIPVAPTQVLLVDNSTNIKAQLGLTSVSYPWGSGSWDEFITHCQTDSTVSNAGYSRKYGGANLVNYLLRTKYQYSQCNDLWRTPHYPFHSVKQGGLLFATFLEDLGFGDELGAVSYDVNARIEQTLNYDGFDINISDDPISDRFTDLRNIVSHRQAAHYSSNTNIGGGIRQAKLMLDASSRPGTRPTMLIMTDGNPTAQDSGWTFPANWDWDALFDYDGDGNGDYYTSNSHAQYALVRAKEAVDAGYTIHTLTVGSGADPTLMRAIAWMGRGITIDVPGGQSVQDMEAQVLEAFNRIASFVPPAKLVSPE